MNNVLFDLSRPHIIGAVLLPLILSAIILAQGIKRQEMDTRFILVWLVSIVLGYQLSDWVPGGAGMLGYRIEPVFGLAAILLRPFWRLSYRMLFALTFFATLTVDCAGDIVRGATVYHDWAILLPGLGGAGWMDSLIWTPVSMVAVSFGFEQWARFRRYTFLPQIKLQLA